MRIIRHPRKKKLKDCVVALGTFDGVHRGHQKVIKSAVAYAKKVKAASLAITFDPHPQQLIIPKRGLKLITTLAEREELFCELGIDGVVVIRFSKKHQQLSARAFVKKYLVDKLGVKRVFVGFDYTFGKARKGDVSELKKLGREFGFEVTVIKPVSCQKHVIKSKLIREFVSQGRFSQAIRFLGHSYRLTGKVIKGSGRGKELGFPTANLKVDKNKLIPAQGVYFGLVGKRKCVVNIGARPTFGAGQTVVEVHILNFKKNIRGKNIKVNLLKRLRDEKQFSDVKRLKDQIQRDVNHARLLSV
ncbi:MAG: bifunctional riboflavin kinase/FAD synthetase [Candidatus Margulisbacteria bacterium]|nr:bifunctional riboflavin kinase/FAD synthetase [Candidatus Margulisiibacteriota bacterium]